METNKSKLEKVAEIALNQLEVANKLYGKAADQYDKLYGKAIEQYEKYEALLSKFDLSHLEDNELEELFGFVPYEYTFPQAEIIMKESKIFLTYGVYKSEEDFQKNIIPQEIIFPSSVVEKYLKKKKTI